MNYGFSEGARSILGAARLEAWRLHHGYVGPEHVLLGLFSNPQTRAYSAIVELVDDPSVLRTKLESHLAPGTSGIVAAELPYSPQGREALEGAMREARETDVWDVDSGHLLIGVLGALEGPLETELASTGVSLAVVQTVLDTL